MEILDWLMKREKNEEIEIDIEDKPQPLVSLPGKPLAWSGSARVWITWLRFTPKARAPCAQVPAEKIEHRSEGDASKMHLALELSESHVDAFLASRRSDADQARIRGSAAIPKLQHFALHPT